MAGWAQPRTLAAGTAVPTSLRVYLPRTQAQRGEKARMALWQGLHPSPERAASVRLEHRDINSLKDALIIHINSQYLPPSAASYSASLEALALPQQVLLEAAELGRGAGARKQVRRRDRDRPGRATCGQTSTAPRRLWGGGWFGMR